MIGITESPNCNRHTSGLPEAFLPTGGFPAGRAAQEAFVRRSALGATPYAVITLLWLAGSIRQRRVRTDAAFEGADTPPSSIARTRYVRRVLGLTFVSTNELTFAPTRPISTKSAQPAP
jgi:hypothetical protein